MKNIILAATLIAAPTALLADRYDDKIAEKCGEVKEITYAAYLNSQQGTPLSTTLSRLNTIYRDDEASFEWIGAFVTITYDIPEPPIDKSLIDAATQISETMSTVCTQQLEEALEARIEEEDKVGM